MAIESLSDPTATDGVTTNESNIYDDDDNEFTSQRSAEEEEGDDDKTSLSEQGEDKDFEDKAVSCFRFFVLIILVSAMAAAGASTWYFISTDQSEDFVREFDIVAEAIAEESADSVASILGDCKMLVSTLTSLAISSGANWPLFRGSNFHAIGENFRESSSAGVVVMAPLVDIANKSQWETFSVANQNWIRYGLEWENSPAPDLLETVPSQIYKRENGEMVPQLGAGPYAPMWEMSRAPVDPSVVVNFDALSHETFGHVFEMLQKLNTPVLSDLIDPADFFGDAIIESDVLASLLVYTRLPKRLISQKPSWAR